MKLECPIHHPPPEKNLQESLYYFRTWVIHDRAGAITTFRIPRVTSQGKLPTDGSPFSQEMVNFGCISESPAARHSLELMAVTYLRKNTVAEFQNFQKYVDVLAQNYARALKQKHPPATTFSEFKKMSRCTFTTSDIFAGFTIDIYQEIFNERTLITFDYVCNRLFELDPTKVTALTNTLLSILKESRNGLHAIAESIVAKEDPALTVKLDIPELMMLSRVDIHFQKLLNLCKVFMELLNIPFTDQVCQRIRNVYQQELASGYTRLIDDAHRTNLKHADVRYRLTQGFPKGLLTVTYADGGVVDRDFAQHQDDVYFFWLWFKKYQLVNSPLGICPHPEHIPRKS